MAGKLFAVVTTAVGFRVRLEQTALASAGSGGLSERRRLEREKRLERSASASATGSGVVSHHVACKPLAVNESMHTYNPRI